METVTEDEIREKLSNHYGGDNSSREFVKNERRDSHESTGSVVYSLSGSPPKGYAIAIPGLRKVNLYNHQGERFQILRDTVVKEIFEDGAATKEDTDRDDDPDDTDDDSWFESS